MLGLSSVIIISTVMQDIIWIKLGRLFSTVKMSVRTLNKVILAKGHISPHNIKFVAIPNLWLLLISTNDRGNSLMTIL